MRQIVRGAVPIIEMTRTSLWVLGIAGVVAAGGCQPDGPPPSETARRAATSCGNLCDTVCLGATSCSTECNLVEQVDEDQICQAATCGAASIPCTIDGETPGHGGGPDPGPASVPPCLDSGPHCHPAGNAVLVGRVFRKVLEGQKPHTPRLVTHLYDVMAQRQNCAQGNVCYQVRAQCDYVFLVRNNSGAGAFGFQGDGSCVQLAP